MDFTEDEVNDAIAKVICSDLTDDYDGVSRSDILLAEHYERLFYLAPKELAMAINAMNENELFKFNEIIRKGHGMNVNLMREKLDEISKYQCVNFIFEQAVFLTSVLSGLAEIKDASLHNVFQTYKNMYGDDNDRTGETTANVEPPKIIKDLIDAGQLNGVPESNGKYKPLKTIPKFIEWCLNYGYQDYITSEFILEYIYSENTISTIKEYIRKKKRATQ
jgi:hypothetical protein